MVLILNCDNFTLGEEVSYKVRLGLCVTCSQAGVFATILHNQRTLVISEVFRFV